MKRIAALALVAGSTAAMLGSLWAPAVAQGVDKAQNAALPGIFKSDEYLLLGTATRGAGEPMIAVDPTNPKNMIAVAMGSVQHLGTKDAPALETAGYRAIFNTNPAQHFDGLTDAYHAVPRSTITWLAVTHNGGDSWQVSELPILSGSFTRCPDPFAGVLPDGTFLAGCEPRETSGQFFGKSSVLVSRDHGDTWSKPADIISSYGAARFAPGLKPRIGGNSPWDRPFVPVDDSTGVVYGVAEGGQAIVSTKPETYRWDSFITASTDGGRSFGTIYAWDSKDYPELSRGMGVAAAQGAVGVVYAASSAPTSEKAACPCIVFGLSRDHGKTFERHVLKNVPVAKPSVGKPMPVFGMGGIAGLAADPAKASRFALLRYTAKPAPGYEIAVSDDYGKTWSHFVSAGQTPRAISFTKPWITYSRAGVLGLMWRAIYADRSYDIWSSISKDGGYSFSDSLRVSHDVSPVANPYRNDGLFGDDIQDLVLDNDTAHMVWGDSRAGFQGIWYGSVPLAAYDFPKR
ncbi:MAG: exo-alpha-sialidase [Alphaproteobacteria bacterium]|nr:exo-alpha-sialidase [Alphaproteobacteria bacterium]